MNELFHLNDIYISCRKTDIEFIKSALNKGNYFDVRYAMKQLYVNSYIFGDQDTYAACIKMQTAMAKFHNGGINNDMLYHLEKNIDALARAQ